MPPSENPLCSKHKPVQAIPAFRQSVWTLEPIRRPTLRGAKGRSASALKALSHHLDGGLLPLKSPITESGRLPKTATVKARGEFGFRRAFGANRPNA